MEDNELIDRINQLILRTNHNTQVLKSMDDALTELHESWWARVRFNSRARPWTRPETVFIEPIRILDAKPILQDDEPTVVIERRPRRWAAKGEEASS